jgi:type I restriction enzyme S subunit
VVALRHTSLAEELAERRRRWEDEQESRFNVTGKTPGKDWKAKYKSPAPPQNVTFSELPRTWTLTGFEQLSEGTKHALKAGPFGSALKKEHYASSGYKIYGQEQVIRGDASFGDYFIDAKRFDSLRACSMKPGDILISLVGTAGRVLILPEEASPGIINPRLLKITLSPGSVDPRFVKLVLESPQARSFLRIQAHGGTMEILNLGILKQFPIPLPPIDEQRVIVEAVENIHSIIEHSEADLFRNTEGIKILRQSILRHAFTGRLVPQSPNDQPATELLKQIIVDRERRTHETAHLKRTKVKRQRAVMRRAGQPTKKSLTQK